MKKIHFIIGLILLIAACSKTKKEQDGYVISGNLEHSNSHVLYLAEITDKELIVKDSTRVDNDGNFKFMGNVSEPTIFLLYQYLEDPIKLVVDQHDNINIKGNLTNLALTSEITGTGESPEVAKINKHLFKNLEIIDSLNYVYKISQNKPEFDTLLLDLNRIADSVRTNEKKFLTQYIDNNPGSFTSYIALTQQLGPKNFLFNPKEDLSYFQKVETALIKKYPESKITRGLSAFIKEMKNTLSSIDNLKGEPEPGVKAPDITLKNPAGDIKTLSSLKGKYILLVFWASWCKPCRMENPILVRLHKKYKSSRKGFEIFHVSLDRIQDRNKWEKLIAADNMLEWIHVIDEEQIYSNVYNIEDIPLNFLIDKNGVIIAKDLMGIDLENKLKEVFGY